MGINIHGGTLENLTLSYFPISIGSCNLCNSISCEDLMISDIRFMITRNTVSINIYSCFNMLALKNIAYNYLTKTLL